MSNHLQKSQSVRCYISVGSNINPEKNIATALETLQGACAIIDVSPFYRTAAINRPDQDDYWNGVVVLATDTPPRRLKFDLLRKIEYATGRRRGQDAWAAREIDLDILLYGNLVLREAGLAIPDPDIRTRPFLAGALLALTPVLVMPDSGAPLRDEIDETELSTLTAVRDFSSALKERFCS